MSRPPFMQAISVRRALASLCLPWLLLAVPADAAAAEHAGGACEVASPPGARLAQAKDLFAKVCVGYARRDCDPLGDGTWLCSSEVIGSSAPPLASVPAPQTPPGATGVPPTDDEGACYTRAAELGTARERFAADCAGFARVDCDPIDGAWVCASVVLGDAAPGQPAPAAPEPTPAPEQSPEQQAPEPPPIDIVIVGDPPPTEDEGTPPAPAQPAPSPTPGTGTAIGRISAGDLVALHYDNCPDRDDGHAIAAGKSVVSRSGLGNVLVVNGACGDALRDRFQPQSRAVVRAAWGDDWLDVDAARDASVATAADAWIATLGNGDEVWVAEGGPSDFTAAVLRRMRDLVPSLDLKRVHVVQHSSGSNGWNESNTSPANIALVKELADYIAIPDGNHGGNGSADFQQNSPSFAGIALGGPFANEWRAAFDYLDPNERLDFSDTVELLYLIGDDSTLTVDQFAERYLR